jgi:cephalosporin hydroxylase
MILEHEYMRLCQTRSDIYLHLPRMVALAEELDATRVLELGTRTGVSTTAWLFALEGKGQLVSVDLDAKPAIGDFPHWTFVQGDDTDPEIQAILPRGNDIVFIDTSHVYEHTLTELETYREFVRPGGRMVLHDTMLRRPGGAPARPLFPVKKAIVEFAANHDLAWYEHKDCFGLGVIEIPDA